MFALSVGVRQIDDVLPALAYAFLSGLNASTVGIVALAAVQVRKSQMLVFLWSFVLTYASLQRRLLKTSLLAY